MNVKIYSSIVWWTLLSSFTSRYFGYIVKAYQSLIAEQQGPAIFLLTLFPFWREVLYGASIQAITKNLRSWNQTYNPYFSVCLNVTPSPPGYHCHKYYCIGVEPSITDPRININIIPWQLTRAAVKATDSSSGLCRKMLKVPEEIFKNFDIGKQWVSETVMLLDANSRRLWASILSWVW